MEGALRAAGHEVTRYDGEDMARAAASSRDVARGRPRPRTTFDGPSVESMRMGRELEGVPTLGFYPHVRVRTRGARAEEAGVRLVVPRSRMAREARGAGREGARPR